MSETYKNPLHPEEDTERKTDEVRSVEALAARAHEPPPSPGGKASTAPEDQILRCTEDTITDSDGSYLEPPD